MWQIFGWSRVPRMWLVRLCAVLAASVSTVPVPYDRWWTSTRRPPELRSPSMLRTQVGRAAVITIKLASYPLNHMCSMSVRTTFVVFVSDTDRPCDCDKRHMIGHLPIGRYTRLSGRSLSTRVKDIDEARYLTGYNVTGRRFVHVFTLLIYQGPG